MSITEAILRLLPYIIGALALAWALAHPRAPEGTDPEHWRRSLRAYRRQRKLRQQRGKP